MALWKVLVAYYNISEDTAREWVLEDYMIYVNSTLIYNPSFWCKINDIITVNKLDGSPEDFILSKEMIK